MKRDWNVVRQILLALEDREMNGGGLHDLPECDPAVFAYHVQIMSEGELIHGVVTHWSPPRSSAARLTWKGHELLEEIRHESMWEKIKHSAEEKSVSLTYEVVGMLFKSYVKKKLGIDD